MQNLDVTKTETAWSSLAERIYFPHSEEEYRRLVDLLDSFIDKVGEDESHPLASLMEVVAVLIEKYEDEHVPQLSDVLAADVSTKNYAQAAERGRQFLVTLSVETDALDTKINGYADRMARITKQSNPKEFEAVIRGSANDMELFSQRIEALLPHYRRDLELITEGFAQTLKCLDASTSAGMEELKGFRREAQKLAKTAQEVKPKVAFLRDAFKAICEADYDPRLTKAARRLVTLADHLSAAYEDLETVALKVSFWADKK